MAFATLLLAAAVLTADPVAEACRDDRGSDRCNEARQARMRALYGVKSIEEHARAGDQVRRVFYVDGYGRDLAAIAFVRSPGRDPMVSVHFPSREGARPDAALQALVPLTVWSDLLWRSRSFDLPLAPAAQSEAPICLHSWLFVVEANDPARANLERPSLRRKTEDACGDGLAQQFAGEVQRAALPLFPFCDRLEPRQYRNPVSQLASCRLLSGDRMAAAEALNATKRLEDVRESTDRHRYRGHFAHETKVEWGPERRTLDSLTAADFWADKLAEAGTTNLYYERIEGLAADRAKVTGGLSRFVRGAQGQPDRYYRAPAELVWVFGPAQQWEIAEARVGAWQEQRQR